MPVIRNIEVSGLICASLHGHAFGALHRIIAMFNLFFSFWVLLRLPVSSACFSSSDVHSLYNIYNTVHSL